MTPKQVDGMERRATQHPLRSVTSEENSGPALGGSNLPYPAGLEQRRAKRERLADVQQIKGSCYMMFFDIFRWSISCFHLAVRSGLKPVSCGCGMPSTDLSVCLQRARAAFKKAKNQFLMQFEFWFADYSTFISHVHSHTAGSANLTGSHLVIRINDQTRTIFHQTHSFRFSLRIQYLLLINYTLKQINLKQDYDEVKDQSRPTSPAVTNLRCGAKASHIN